MVVFQRYLLIQYFRSMPGQQGGEGSQHERLDETDEAGEAFPVGRHAVFDSIVNETQENEKKQEKHLRSRNHRPQKRTHKYAIMKLPHNDSPDHAEHDEHDCRPGGDEGLSASTGGHGPHGDKNLDSRCEEDEVPPSGNQPSARPIAKGHR
mmetsp:Transcript_29778/g.59335  ORF Transcript_29778/g.59335 Transcript_29778/m.59335 type:complete len:151 (-) Transcript_29778:323-775(-)